MKTRKCNICNQIKPLSEFYREAGQTDGYAYRCKECDKKKSAKWARESGYNRRETRSNKGNIKRQAKSAVAEAVKKGKIPRVSECFCVDCGKQAREYHHESYEKSRWYDVIPLCVACHRKRHIPTSPTVDVTNWLNNRPITGRLQK